MSLDIHVGLLRVHFYCNCHPDCSEYTNLNMYCIVFCIPYGTSFLSINMQRYLCECETAEVHSFFLLLLPLFLYSSIAVIHADFHNLYLDS